MNTPKKDNSFSVDLFKGLDWIAIVILVFLFLRYWIDDPARFYPQMIFIILALVLTIVTRTISARFSFAIYARGLFIGVGLTLLLGAIYDLIGDVRNDYLSYVVIFPVIEEIAKILPVILTGWLVYKGSKIVLNPSDWFLMGSMSGVAFAMSEEFYRSGSYCWSCNAHYGPHIGNFYFFTDAYGYDLGNQIIGYVGHGAATGFIAIMIGLALYLYKNPKFRSWCWTLPLGAFLWISLEHMGYNAHPETEFLPKVLSLVGGGALTPWLITAALVAALFIDGRTLKTALKKSKKLSAIKKFGIQKTKKFVKKRQIPSFVFVRSVFSNLRLLNRAASFYYHSKK